MPDERRVPHLCQDGDASGMEMSMKVGKGAGLSHEDHGCCVLVRFHSSSYRVLQ